MTQGNDGIGTKTMAEAGLRSRLSGRFAATLAALLLSSAALFGHADDAAPTSVWVVSSGDEKVYLGGTVHLLRASDYPLPPQYEQAYQDSQQLVFETDISAMNDPSLQARMLQEWTYQDERTLKTVLDEEAYTALAAHMEKVGMPIAMVQKFKPGMLSSTLSVIEMQKMGFTPQGVDTYYNTRAMGDAKPVGQLETVDDQIALIANMGEGNESEFILLALQDLEKANEMLEDMITAWRSGNEEQMAALFLDDMQEQAPEVYKDLLVDRNHNWLPQIEAMFDDEGTEFVLVGAAHLFGDDGLLALLAGKGYDISRL